MRQALEQLHTLRNLWRHPRRSREKLIAFQNRELRAIVENAYENVPYYRALFDRARIRPADIRTAEDLPAVPITSKQDMRTEPPENLLSGKVNPRRVIEHTTSGSTGRPLTVRYVPSEGYLLHRFRLRARRQFGGRDSDLVVAIRDVTKIEPKGKIREVIRRVRGVGRSEVIKCQQPVEDIARELDRLDPDGLHGYPGTIAALAPLVSGGRFPNIRPRYITTAAESMPPSMRRRIEEAFGARVFDFYVATEFVLLAWECTETGLYHICDDGLVLEILKDGRPAVEGETGEVVGTNLHAYAMPYIRYRLGDVVTKGPTPCPCGQPFATLKNIQGRMIDYLQLRDGRLIHPYEIFVPLVENVDWIDQFQLFQDCRDRIVMRIVPFRRPGDEELRRFIDLGTETLGAGGKFEVRFLDEIPPEANGKYRMSKSLLNSEYEDVESTRLHGRHSADQSAE